MTTDGGRSGRGGGGRSGGGSGRRPGRGSGGGSGRGSGARPRGQQRARPSNAPPAGGGSTPEEEHAKRASEDFKAFLQSGFDLAQEAKDNLIGSRVSDLVGWASGGRMGGDPSGAGLGFPSEDQLKSVHDKAGELRVAMATLMSDAVSVFDDAAKWMLEVTRPNPQPPGTTPGMGAAERDAARRAAGTLVPEVFTGKEGRMPLTVRNPRWATVDARFTCSGLQGPPGTLPIKGETITFDPATVTMEPRAVQHIAMVVPVPADAVPGPYYGTATIEGVENSRYFVMIEVIQSPPDAGGGAAPAAEAARAEAARSIKWITEEAQPAEKTEPETPPEKETGRA